MGLFSSGGSKKVATTTTGQRQLLDDLSERMMGELGNAGPVYQGSLVPGRNSLMSTAINSANGGIGANPMIGSALDASLSGGYDQQAIHDRFSSALGPARLEFDRALDQVGAMYGDTWGTSGAHADMVGRATSEYGMGLADMLGGMTYNASEAALDRQLNAVPMAIQADQNEFDQLGNMFNLGMQDRSIDAQQNAADYSKWLSGQWYNNPALGLLTPTLGTQAFGVGEQAGLGQTLTGIGAVMHPL